MLVDDNKSMSNNNIKPFRDDKVTTSLEFNEKLIADGEFLKNVQKEEKNQQKN